MIAEEERDHEDSSADTEKTRENSDEKSEESERTVGMGRDIERRELRQKEIDGEEACHDAEKDCQIMAWDIAGEDGASDTADDKTWNDQF